MKIAAVIDYLETLAPASLQEAYDNAGLLTGQASWDCSGVLVALDVTEAVIREAVSRKCNLVITHHPVIFGGLKKITGSSYVEQTIIAAVKQDIAVYAIHTNLDNVVNGVNGRMAAQLGLVHSQVLQPKKGVLRKLITFVPVKDAEEVRSALFAAGAGHIGKYSECSFGVGGKGTFKGEAGTQPYVGEAGRRHEEHELRLEVIFPAWLEKKLLAALMEAHPYEEVAYDIVLLQNAYAGVGSGMIGELAAPMTEEAFFHKVKEAFGLAVIRHTSFLNKPVKKVALCGGAGSFLINTAVASGADVYLTGDIKYHEFFDANGRLVVADIGHYESEQYTVDLLVDVLSEKFSSFAVLKTGVHTNPVHYFS